MKTLNINLLLLFRLHAYLLVFDGMYMNSIDIVRGDEEPTF
jgi:hypothetical protein